MTTTAATTAAPAEATTTSSPERLSPHGRPDPGAAVARTEELYARHGKLVGGLCRALLRDPAEAEDAAQQTFLSAHRALVNGSSPEEPAAWLATIARNECWARIRRRMREPLPTSDLEREASSSDPLAEAIRNADLAAMWRALAGLPPQQREALLLREFGGLSYEELAGALAVSSSAVESLLFRARQGVRTRLKAAYAGVAGASWLESLARLAGGLGGGMAPVAAKVAAVGVGAAVVSGGAVVAPSMLEHHARPHGGGTGAARTVSTTEGAVSRPVSTPAIVLFQQSQTAHTAGSSHRGSESKGEDSASATDGSAGTVGDDSGSGDSRQATSVDGSHSEGDRQDASSTSSSTGEGEDSGSGRKGSPPSGQTDTGQTDTGQTDTGQTDNPASGEDGTSGSGSDGGSSAGSGDGQQQDPGLTITVPETLVPAVGGGDD